MALKYAKHATIPWASDMALTHLMDAGLNIARREYRQAEASARCAVKYLESAARMKEEARKKRKKK
jgi:hypothetical protein